MQSGVAGRESSRDRWRPRERVSLRPAACLFPPLLQQSAVRVRTSGEGSTGYDPVFPVYGWRCCRWTVVGLEGDPRGCSVARARTEPNRTRFRPGKNLRVLFPIVRVLRPGWGGGGVAWWRGRRCEPGLRSSLLQQMEALVRMLKGFMCPYLTHIVELVSDCWSVSRWLEG